MIVAVRYRVDAHRYSPAAGACLQGCRACELERRLYRSEEAALAAQPADELARPAGDHGCLAGPQRRFDVVVISFLD